MHHLFKFCLLFTFLSCGTFGGKVTRDTRESESDELIRHKRNSYIRANMWPNATVNYYLAPEIQNNPTKNAAVSAAVKYISDRSCVKFVQSSTASNRIKIINQTDCYANSGMLGGEQVVALGDGCGEFMDIVIQQFLFALGFIYHQVRPDRDDYLTINLADINAIPQSLRPFYNKLPAADTDLTVPYEYGSVMHFGPSVNQSGVTLPFTAKQADFQNTMGTGKVSFYDIMMVNLRYCKDTCKPAFSAPCSWGGYPNPNNCLICNCPTGYSGDWCLSRAETTPACGAVLTATPQWQSVTVNFGVHPAGPAARKTFLECTHWVTAPPSAMIQVRFTYIYEQCVPGCKVNGIELKLQSPRSSGIRLCCQSSANRIFESPMNPLPILAYNKWHVTVFTMEYRHL